MNTKNISIVIILISGIYQAQMIDTVMIKNNPLKEYGISQKIISLGKEEMKRNTLNLSEALRQSTPLFIKENGRGMVSSPSARGTSAPQTLFLWNNIPINSMFLGQGDINNIGLFHYDQLSLKMGAGSLHFGSGAMGASIHLNTDLPYHKDWYGTLFSEYASFNTLQNALKIGYSNAQFSIKHHITFSQSDNNYQVPQEKYTNINGNYRQLHYGISAGYRLHKDHEITLHTLISNGTQHYPIFEETTTKTKYLTHGIKSQINWLYNGKNLQNTTTAAYLIEAYDYFADIDNKASNGATGTTAIFKNTTSYRLPSNMRLSLITEAQYNEGKGYQSGIKNPKRTWGSAVLSLSKPIGERSSIEATARKNIISHAPSPWLLSTATRINVRDWWTFNLNISKNFRLPTFNDLYWQPGGNTSLLPETAWQFEAMQKLTFGAFQAEVVPYISFFKDMIQWRPTPNGYWSPFNITEVRTYGAEIYTTYGISWGTHRMEAKGMYAFTQSQDRNTGRQNMYVPTHKASGSISFHTPKWNAYVQGLYNGRTYTTTDENPSQALKAYFLANAGAGFQVGKSIELGGKINNIFNQVYHTVAYYPLPLRNYSMYMNVSL